DSAIKELSKHGMKFHFAITATTRPARSNEQEGVDYFFYKEEEFERLIKDGSLVEHDLVYGYYKGVLRDQIEPAIARGEDVIIRPDVTGALKLRKLFPDAVLILLIPESLEQLSTRLEERGTESSNEIAMRVSIAQSELSQIKQFDYVIVNRDGKLSQTASCIEAIVAAEKCRVGRYFR